MKLADLFESRQDEHQKSNRLRNLYIERDAAKKALNAALIDGDEDDIADAENDLRAIKKEISELEGGDVTESHIKRGAYDIFLNNKDWSYDVYLDDNKVHSVKFKNADGKPAAKKEAAAWARAQYGVHTHT